MVSRVYKRIGQLSAWRLFDSIKIAKNITYDWPNNTERAPYQICRGCESDRMSARQQVQRRKKEIAKNGKRKKRKSETCMRYAHLTHKHNGQSSSENIKNSFFGQKSKWIEMRNIFTLLRQHIPTLHSNEVKHYMKNLISPSSTNGEKKSKAKKKKRKYQTLEACFFCIRYIIRVWRTGPLHASANGKRNTHTHTRTHV